MLEAGDTYKGWSLSINDYSYVGGNMLAGSRTLDAGMEKDGIITVAGYGDKAVIYKDNSSGTTWSNVLQYTLTGAIEGNMDYMLSLWVKGSGKVQLYLYNGSVTKQIEGSEGWSDTATDGKCDVVLTSEWKRIWVHWRTLQTINSTVSVLARCPAGSKLFVAGMKLEKGAMMTEYSESSEDLVSKTALLACGIDITSHKIVMTADLTKVQDQSGDEIAVFAIDGDGNPYIKTGLIKADEVVTSTVLAGKITGSMVKQPFETYNSIDDWAAGHSFSWYINNASVTNFVFFTNTSYNGVTVNVFNGTSTSINISLMTIVNEDYGYGTTYNVVIPPYRLMQALAIYDPAYNVIKWYLLVPYTLSGSTITIANSKK